MIIGNAWDTELSPGRTSLNGASRYPCAVYDASVGWEDRGIFSDSCNVWYHIGSRGMSSIMYNI